MNTQGILCNFLLTHKTNSGTPKMRATKVPQIHFKVKKPILMGCTDWLLFIPDFQDMSNSTLWGANWSLILGSTRWRYVAQCHLSGWRALNTQHSYPSKKTSQPTANFICNFPERDGQRLIDLDWPYVGQWIIVTLQRPLMSNVMYSREKTSTCHTPLAQTWIRVKSAGKPLMLAID